MKRDIESTDFGAFPREIVNHILHQLDDVADEKIAAKTLLSLYLSKNNAVYREVAASKIVALCEKKIGKQPKELGNIGLGTLVHIYTNLVDSEAWLQINEVKRWPKIQENISRNKGHFWRIFSILNKNNLIYSLSVKDYATILTAWRYSGSVSSFFQMLDGENILTVALLRKTLNQYSKAAAGSRILKEYQKLGGVSESDVESIFNAFYFQKVNKIERMFQYLAKNNLSTRDIFFKVISLAANCHVFFELMNSASPVFLKKVPPYVIRGFLKNFPILIGLQRAIDMLSNTKISPKMRYHFLLSENDNTKDIMYILEFLNEIWPASTTNYSERQLKTLCDEMPRVLDYCYSNSLFINPSCQSRIPSMMKIFCSDLKRAGILTLENLGDFLLVMPRITRLFSDSSELNAIRQITNLGLLSQENYLAIFKKLAHAEHPLSEVLAQIPPQLSDLDLKRILQIFLNNIHYLPVINQVLISLNKSSFSGKKIHSFLFKNSEYTHRMMRTICFLSPSCLKELTQLSQYLQDYPRFFDLIPECERLQLQADGMLDIDWVHKGTYPCFKALQDKGLLTLENLGEIFKRVPNVAQILSKPSVMDAVELFVNKHKVLAIDRYTKFLQELEKSAHPVAETAAFMLNMRLHCTTPKKYIALLRNRQIVADIFKELWSTSISQADYLEFLKRKFSEANAQSVQALEVGEISIQPPGVAAATVMPHNTEGNSEVNQGRIALSGSPHVICSENQNKRRRSYSEDQSRCRKKQKTGATLREKTNEQMQSPR